MANPIKLETGDGSRWQEGPATMFRATDEHGPLVIDVSQEAWREIQNQCGAREDAIADWVERLAAVGVWESRPEHPRYVMVLFGNPDHPAASPTAV